LKMGDNRSPGRFPETGPVIPEIIVNSVLLEDRKGVIMGKKENRVRGKRVVC